MIIIGHSLSDIDKDYFYKVHELLNEDANWIFTYYSNEDKDNYMNFIPDCGIDEENVIFVKIEEYLK